MLTEGSETPSIVLTNQNGESVDIATYRGRRVLVYFYPKANTPGCTQQTCLLEEVRSTVGDTVIVGISPDTPKAQKHFADKYSIGFDLLSDADHAVAEAFDVWQEKKNYGKTYMGTVRSAFLVGPDGRIEHAWYKISPKDTPKNLLAALGR